MDDFIRSRPPRTQRFQSPGFPGRFTLNHPARNRRITRYSSSKTPSERPPNSPLAVAWPLRAALLWGMARKRADYRPRIADAELTELLAASGAVLVEGARGWSARRRRRCRPAPAMCCSTSDLDAQRMMGKDVDPAAVLTGDPPRLLDEWQLAPEIWNHVRRAVDEHSGAWAVHPDRLGGAGRRLSRAHTGAGRFTRLRMAAHVALQRAAIPPAASLCVACSMGSPSGDTPHPSPLPSSLNASPSAAGQPTLAVPRRRPCASTGAIWTRFERTDVSRLDGRLRDPARVGRLLQSLARNLATAWCRWQSWPPM